LQEKAATKNKLWSSDSGCSKHMTGDASLLTNFNESRQQQGRDLR